MNEPSPPETRELVALLRSLSPSSLPERRPEIPSFLADRVGRRLPRGPRALLFDLYGTLFSSAAGGEPGLAGSSDPDQGEGARRLLAKELEDRGFVGGPESFASRVDAGIHDFRALALASQPFPEINIVEIVASILPGADTARWRRLALLHEAWRNPCAPMPGALELLSGLAARGVRLGIVSNAQFYTRILFEAILGGEPERLGFEDGLSIYSYQLGIAKPSPEPFALAAGPLRDSGMDYSEILVVGNSASNDIAPAAALGMMTALFAGDARSFRPGPGTILPSTAVEGLAQLPDLFPPA